MEEGKGERYLASGRQYGDALIGVRHQEEEEEYVIAAEPAEVDNAHLSHCIRFLTWQDTAAEWTFSHETLHSAATIAATRPIYRIP